MSPIYDYECSHCGAVFEMVLGVSENRTVSCRSCGCRETKRLISLPATKSDKGDNEYPYVEHNLGDEPVLVQDRAHKNRLLKERGLSECYKQGRGMPGQWI
uniref:Putative regulatory protein FmdB zinc ribbon domain-containing protein n=1 Tax=viral metagenome TaxID=1070528 RepID=A0A6M3L4M6_9ZZZZ